MISDESLDREVDFKPGQDVGTLHYWRKHPNLHGCRGRVSALHRKIGAQFQVKIRDVFAALITHLLDGALELLAFVKLAGARGRWR